MDITILSPFGPLDIAPLAIQLFTKQIDRNSKIKTFKGKEVTIIRQNPGVMHLDGEPIMADSRIEISVLPKSLNVLTPETVSFTEEVQNLFGVLQSRWSADRRRRERRVALMSVRPTVVSVVHRVRG